MEGLHTPQIECSKEFERTQLMATPCLAICWTMMSKISHQPKSVVAATCENRGEMLTTLHETAAPVLPQQRQDGVDQVLLYPLGHLLTGHNPCPLWSWRKDPIWKVVAPVGEVHPGSHRRRSWKPQVHNPCTAELCLLKKQLTVSKIHFTQRHFNIDDGHRQREVQNSKRRCGSSIF